MITKVLKEEGYNEALLGLSLSFKDGLIPLGEWWTPERMGRMEERARSLACKGNGHNKFLRFITVWIYVKAPRSWWQELSTYKVGLVEQSGSTMHTLHKRPVAPDDFAYIDLQIMEIFNRHLEEETEGFTKKLRREPLKRIKHMLPEGYYQERIIVTNYATIQNIVRQRRTHQYTLWNDFLAGMQLEHPFLVDCP